MNPMGQGYAGWLNYINQFRSNPMIQGHPYGRPGEPQPFPIGGGQPPPVGGGYWHPGGNIGGPAFGGPPIPFGKPLLPYLPAPQPGQQGYWRGGQGGGDPRLVGGVPGQGTYNIPYRGWQGQQGFQGEQGNQGGNNQIGKQ